MAALFDEDEIDRIWLEMALDEFSEPRDESDLVIVVEGHNFYVHRLILKMASPVFKTMLEGNFKERDAKEIHLPGKKAEDFVCLLRLIYPNCKDNISVYTLEPIYKLADEYQIDRLKYSCKEVLTSTKITSQNVFKVLECSKFLDDKDVEKTCYDFLEQQTVATLQTLNAFEGLDDPESVQLLTKKATKLEKCLKSALPQFIGVLDCMVHLWVKAQHHKPPSPCLGHYTQDGRVKEDTTLESRLSCEGCKAMWSSMESNAFSHHERGYLGVEKFYFYSPVPGMNFDVNLPSVIGNMMNLLSDAS